MKTSELIDQALDFAVAQAIGTKPVYNWRAFGVKHYGAWETDPAFGSAVMLRPYSTDWAQGGPIIGAIKGFEFKHWLESKPDTCCEAHIHNYEGDWIQFGPTQLIAALRCYVASKLGDAIDIPEGLGIITPLQTPQSN